MVYSQVLELETLCSRTLPSVNYVPQTDNYSALIAVQAGVERRDMAVVTSFRK